MNTYNATPQPSFFARHRVLVPVVAVLLVCGMTFGAIAVYQSLFVTVEVNGQTVGTHEIVLDGENHGHVVIPLNGAAADGELVEISISGDAAPGMSGGMTTINATAGGDELELDIDVEQEDMSKLKESDGE